jgi:6-phosphogluconolactonase
MTEELLPDESVPDATGALRGLPGARVITPDALDLVDWVARDMSWLAHRRVYESGVFHLALSGGSTPQQLYRSLMIDPRYRLFPWRRTHLWMVDERCVDLEDERSNFKMIREMIVDHSDIPRAHVHPMPVLEADGPRQYENELRGALGTDESLNRLDYVLLGMGSDGHTASLFPRTPALGEQERWIALNDGETIAAPRPRLTMTYPLINSARRLGVLITGEGKHATLQQVDLASRSDRPDVQRLPIVGVRPIYDDAELVWYMDYAAALGPAR